MKVFSLIILIYHDIQLLILKHIRIKLFSGRNLGLDSVVGKKERKEGEGSKKKCIRN